MSCSRCGQNCHDQCIRELLPDTYIDGKVINPYKLAGVHYLCQTYEKMLPVLTYEISSQQTPSKSNELLILLIADWKEQIEFL